MSALRCVVLSGLWPPVERRGGAPLLSTGGPPALPRLPHPPAAAAGRRPPASQLPTPCHRAVRRSRREAHLSGVSETAQKPQSHSPPPVLRTACSWTRMLSPNRALQKGCSPPPSRLPSSPVSLDGQNMKTNSPAHHTAAPSSKAEEDVCPWFPRSLLLFFSPCFSFLCSD